MCSYFTKKSKLFSLIISPMIHCCPHLLYTRVVSNARTDFILAKISISFLEHLNCIW